MNKHPSTNMAILIVCRSISEVNLLSRIRPQSGYRYIVASDDTTIHKEVEKYPWVDDFCWIEKIESFYHVADDVIRFLEIINRWLESLGDNQHGIPKELLFWIRHCEGGMTTQRIQDVLLLIRSYLHLFDTYKISSVIVLSHPGKHWEDDVLIETARSKDIHVNVFGGLHFRVLLRKAWAFLLPYATTAYYSLNILRINLRKLFTLEKSEICDKEIVFQLCSSSYKHVQNIIPVMKALKDKAYNPIALCWHASERYTTKSGADQVRQEGLWAEQLENWTPFLAVCTGYRRVFRTWRKALCHRDKVNLHNAFQYRSVSLGALLWPSVRFFIIGELSQRYCLHVSLLRYFESHSPLAIKLWGSNVMFEGYMAWKSLNVANKKPYVFEYWLGNTLAEWPYKPIKPPVDLFLAAGEFHKKLLEQSRGMPSSKIAVVGQSRYDHLFNFKQKYSRSQSLAYLNIPSGYSTYILYDSGYFLRGYLAISEQQQVTDMLLAIAKRHSALALIIKPHPCHKTDFLESQIEENSLVNVFLVDKKMSPYHPINASNILITKYSTIGNEAFIFERPVISVLLDGDQRWKCYGEAAEYVYSSDQLNYLLHKILTNRNFRSQWISEQKRKQNDFLKEYFVNISCPVAEIKASEILKRIE